MEKNDFDFFYLTPKHGTSELSSRTQPSLDSGFLGLYPLFSSPMKAISEKELVIEMGKLNCLGILHRFDSLEKRRSDIDDISKHNVPFGIAIGINDFEYELGVAEYAVKRGAVMIVLDIANGYLQRLKYIGYTLRDSFPAVGLMTGNVITKNGAETLMSYGFDFIRVGIGGGSNCKTREITGVGRNNMAAIMDCSYVDSNIVADGGITEPGKAVKAFACGANFVMLGSALAHANESKNDGKIFGMASMRNHLENNKQIKSIEGFDSNVTKPRQPLKEIIDEYLWGIKSACTYLDCWTYKDIQHNSNIVRVYEFPK